MKIRIKCSKCNWEKEMEIQLSPLGSLKPSKEILKKGIKIKMTKELLDKIADLAGGLGASREELSQIGIEISPEEWKDALERRKLRNFIRKNLRVSKEKRKGIGEKFQLGTAPWQMGDSFKEIDLASSEVSSMGIEDLRLIPGVTLKKRVYETIKGQGREVLKGTKVFEILDVSGSMIGGGRLSKIRKALSMAEETWKICKKLGFDYHLAIFSDRATRIPKKRIKFFFKDEKERASYPGWNGGTQLSSALKLYSLEELKDGNLIIFSDMDIADLDRTKEKLKEIGNVTNSFKIVLIEWEKDLSLNRIKQTEDLFPEKNVKILKIPLS